MKEVLNELTEHRSLTKDQARKVLTEIAEGKSNPGQTAAFMTIFMMRDITIEELAGFRDAMLDLCVRIVLDRAVMDVCGTGGDGKNTFNISTLSSFVVAGVGQPVAKHGNYGVSSVHGSSNLLEYFGHKFTTDTDKLKRHLDRSGICFLHAPLFHPAMKNVAPIRKELGVKTFFNMLGPLVNPAFPKIQLAGVFSLELARQYGYLYQLTDKKYIILHTIDGYDEISLTAPIKYFSNAGEEMLDPASLGFRRATHESLNGGASVEEAATIFLDVLQGNGTETQNEVVIANAGMALYCADSTGGLAPAMAKAKESLDSGKAYQSFKNLMIN